MTAHISTVDGITVVVGNRPYHVANTDKIYGAVLQAVNDGEDESYISDILGKVRRGVEAVVNITPNMEFNAGAILHNGVPLHGYAVDKLVDLIHNGHEAYPLACFLEKLQKNPSQQTIENLYQFLEYGRIPITKNGNFLAYKAVRADWSDIHSGRFDNSIGATPEMPRNAVDDRREVTCSRGLHVCSFEYLPMFSHANGHVVLCEIDPADVVSIPSDYNNTKMRVCKYRVVGEVEGYYEEHRDVLAEEQVWDPDYTVFARVEDTDEWTEVESYDDREQAIEIAETELQEGEDGDGNPWGEVKVVDSHGVVVFRSRNEE